MYYYETIWGYKIIIYALEINGDISLASLQQKHDLFRRLILIIYLSRNNLFKLLIGVMQKFLCFQFSQGYVVKLLRIIALKPGEAEIELHKGDQVSFAEQVCDALHGVDIPLWHTGTAKFFLQPDSLFGANAKFPLANGFRHSIGCFPVHAVFLQSQEYMKAYRQGAYRSPKQRKSPLGLNKEEKRDLIMKPNN